MQDIEKLKYPIGKFEMPEIIDKNIINKWIHKIEEFPEKIKLETESLSEIDLEKQYRPDGWTIRQIIHHCADSHMNSIIRFKLALTEDVPTIKPYSENLWADLSDTKKYPIESALKLLEGLHEKWVYLLKNLSDSELEKEFLHPENREKIALKTNIGIYAWHCEHHLAHIKNAKITQ